MVLVPALKWKELTLSKSLVSTNQSLTGLEPFGLPGRIVVGWGNFVAFYEYGVHQSRSVFPGGSGP
jgi:hypothetical protein